MSRTATRYLREKNGSMPSYEGSGSIESMGRAGGARRPPRQHGLQTPGGITSLLARLWNVFWPIIAGSLSARGCAWTFDPEMGNPDFVEIRMLLSTSNNAWPRDAQP